MIYNNTCINSLSPNPTQPKLSETKQNKNREKPKRERGGKEGEKVITHDSKFSTSLKLGARKVL